MRGGERLGNARISWKYQALGGKRKDRGLLPRDKGLNLSLRVVPRHADFPAQPKIEREIGFYLPTILNEGAAITRPGIQELLGGLGIGSRAAGAGRAEEKVGNFISGHRSIKREPTIGIRIVTLVDLQVAEFTSKFQSMISE